MCHPLFSLVVCLVILGVAITLVVKHTKKERFDSGLASYLTSKCLENGNRPVVLVDFPGKYVSVNCDELSFNTAMKK